MLIGQCVILLAMHKIVGDIVARRSQFDSRPNDFSAAAAFYFVLLYMYRVHYR